MRKALALFLSSSFLCAHALAQTTALAFSCSGEAAVSSTLLPWTGELVGVVRIHSDSIYESGEYAILLRSDRKGQGLGWALMQLLIEYARTEGLQRISGQVLRDNTTMLAMCRELGFNVTSDPTDPGLQVVTLPLRT